MTYYTLRLTNFEDQRVRGLPQPVLSRNMGSADSSWPYIHQLRSDSAGNAVPFITPPTS